MAPVTQQRAGHGADTRDDSFRPNECAEQMSWLLFSWSLAARTFDMEDVVALHAWPEIAVHKNYEDAEVLCRQKLREHRDFVLRYEVG